MAGLQNHGGLSQGISQTPGTDTQDPRQVPSGGSSPKPTHPPTPSEGKKPHAVDSVPKSPDKLFALPQSMANSLWPTVYLAQGEGRLGWMESKG